MTIDRVEAKRRGFKSVAKTSTKHPYAAIEHRVIDSPAYADLTFSARSLLVLIARQLSRDNNGRLQATYSYLRNYGFDSDRTISRAAAELIAHGFIYRTRAGGYQQGAAQYAVTWLSLCKDRSGLFTDNFQGCAWRDWVPEKKTPPTKLRAINRKFGGLTGAATDKNTVRPPVKTADIELMPCSSAADGDFHSVSEGKSKRKTPVAKTDDWIPGYFNRLRNRGLMDACPVAGPGGPVAYEKATHEAALLREYGTPFN